MQDWNVVITVQGQQYETTRQALGSFGNIARTEYYNVLVMQVADIPQFLEGLGAYLEGHPDLYEGLARVVPVTCGFLFQSAEEFETRTQSAVTPWLDELAAKRFHVRMHRRGFKGRLSSQSEEQFLDHYIIVRTTAAGAAAQVDFHDPDYILVVETVGQRAGLSMWSRVERERFSFLKLD